MGGSHKYSYIKWYRKLSIFFITSTIERAIDESTQLIAGKRRLNIYCIEKKGTSSKRTELDKFGCQDSEENTINGQAIVNEAMKHLGKPCVWGEKGPTVLDCSGFTSYVYRNVAGIEIGGDTYSQINSGREVSQSELKPGDLISPYAGHVCIYRK